MAEIYEPFNNSRFMYDEGWSLVFFSIMNDGVVPLTATSLQVFTEADGRQVKMNVGSAVIMGHRYSSDTVINIPVPNNSSGSERRDLVVLKMDSAAGKITPVIKTGTPGSLQWPTLTRTFGTEWEINLALLRVPNNFTSLSSDLLIDARHYAGPKIEAGRLGFTDSNVAPPGWAIPLGQLSKRARYPDYFASVGTSYDPNVAADEFRFPHWGGRTPIGAGTSADDAGLTYTNRTNGGARQQALSVANLPPHSHSINDPGHTHLVDGGGGNRWVVTVPSSTLYITNSGAIAVSYTDIDPAFTGITVGTTGSALPVSRMQPYNALTPIIKVH